MSMVFHVISALVFYIWRNKVSVYEGDVTYATASLIQQDLGQTRSIENGTKNSLLHWGLSYMEIISIVTVQSNIACYNIFFCIFKEQFF